MSSARPRPAAFVLLALALGTGLSRAQEPGTVLDAWIDQITGNDDAARGMALYPNGSFIAVGSAFGPSGNYDSVIVRYNADGTRDLSFGGYGTGARIHAWSPTGPEYVQCAALQSDGKALAAGALAGAVKNTGLDCFVVRYLSDGTPDPSFGTGGRSVFLASKANDRCYDVTVQFDGKIVLVGMGNPASTKGRTPSPNRTIVARLMPNGALDTSFASGGVASLAIGSGWSGAGAVAIQSDGKIVVGGDAAGGILFALRLNPNGSLDTGFGAGGIRLVSVPGADTVSGVGGCLRLQPDGKIVLGGWEDESTDVAWMTLVRLNPNGSLDTTFNGTGIQASAVPSSLYSLTLDPAGRIIACGFGYVDGVGGMMVARFTGGGQLDTTFNASGATPGYVHRSLVIPGGGFAHAILYRPQDNTILVGGRGNNFERSLFGYLRIQN